MKNYLSPLFYEKMKKFMLVIALFSSLFTINAQPLNKVDQPTAVYAVQLGVFDESVKQADFEAIRSYAYVYKRDGIVFVGGFASEEAAEPVLAKIKAKGYDDAFIATRSLVKNTKNVHVIQIASKNAGEAIDWKKYAKVGDLFSMPSLGVVRIVHGYYTDINDARVKLKEVQNLGFSDAFIKTVKDAQINIITDFDTGDSKLVFQSENKGEDKMEEAVVRSKGDIPTVYNTIPNKRKSAIKLQEALKEVGTYGGAVDGMNGKGTTAAYDKALKLNRRLATYNDMAQKYEGFEGWEDIRLLMTISRQLNTKDNVQPIIADMLESLPETPLSAKEAKAALDWHANTWKGLEKWSALSQYNDQVYTALKIAYYRSLVHLEDYYASKKIGSEAGTALAVYTLKTLIDEDLEGYK
jgi:hypothetical protein